MKTKITDSTWSAILSLLSPQYPGITRQELMKALDKEDKEDKAADDRYLDMAEACDFLRCSRMTIHRLKWRGVIHPRHIGKKLLFSLKELKNAVE